MSASAGTPRFQVNLGAVTAEFLNVDGLESAPPAAASAGGNESTVQPTGTPALGGVGNLTLRDGRAADDSAFWTWCSSIALGTAGPRTIVITLLDATTPQRSWILGNAWPTEITGTEPEPAGDQVAIASVEIAYETLTVAAP